MALYTTTDMMVSFACFNASVRDALRSECGISVTEYRLLAFLVDRKEPAKPADATEVLGLSPAMTTKTANELVEKLLVERVAARGTPALLVTARGVMLSHDADIVLEHVHELFFSPLTSEHKDLIVVSTQMTIMAVTKANRMKDDSFFGEYETFHAFLLFEKLMTETAQSCGLSMNGFRILFHINERGGITSPGELSEQLILAPSAIAYAIKALERDGFIARCAPKLDKRQRPIRITDRGAAVFCQADRRIDSLLSSGFRNASANEKKAIQKAATIIATSLRISFQRGV